MTPQPSTKLRPAPRPANGAQRSGRSGRTRTAKPAAAEPAARSGKGTPSNVRQSLQKAARAPRLSITLPQDVRAIVHRLASLNGTPEARIIAEVISEAAPVLHKVADAIERVQQVNAEKSAAIRASLAYAQAEAEKTAATALALLDRIAAVPAVGAQRSRQEDDDADGSLDAISPEPPPSC